MSFPTSVLEARTIHAYTAVMVLAGVFHILGLVAEFQLAIVTLFFGFVALLDELADLSRSIESVDSRLESVDRQLAQVTGQLTRVNDTDQDQDPRQDRASDHDHEHSSDPDR